MVHVCSTFIRDFKSSRLHVDKFVANCWRSRRQGDWNVGVWLVLSGKVKAEYRWVMKSWCRTVRLQGLMGKTAARKAVCVEVDQIPVPEESCYH